MFRDRLIEVFNKYDIELTDKQADDFVDYRDLLLKWNEIHNLTNIVDDEGVIIKHFLDSVLPYKPIVNNSKIIDIGTGAGFPSIPLKIMNRTLRFTLIDSVNKKLDFVRTVCEQLHFENVEVIHTRAEDLANNPKYRESFDYGVARAVSGMTTILEYAIPFLKVGGKFLCYKGINYNAEILGAKNTMDILKCNILNVDKFHIEELDTDRYVLEVIKTDMTPKKYPRGKNLPKDKPLN